MPMHAVHIDPLQIRYKPAKPATKGTGMSGVGKCIPVPLLTITLDCNPHGSLNPWQSLSMPIVQTSKVMNK